MAETSVDNRFRIALGIVAGVAGFSLLLLIISVGTVVWADDNDGSSVGLFRKCFAEKYKGFSPDQNAGCFNANQITQGGLSVFGLLLLVFAIAATIAAIFLRNQIVLFVALGLLYFSSMFVMAAYATWGTYSRDPAIYAFPAYEKIGVPAGVHYTSMGSSYHLCVAAHYFLWTALTLLAAVIGYDFRGRMNSST